MQVKGFVVFHDLRKCIFVDFIAVDKKYRRQGVGRTLINALPQNVPMELIVDRLNTTAFNFYRANGFDQCDNLTHYIPHIDQMGMCRYPSNEFVTSVSCKWSDIDDYIYDQCKRIAKRYCSCANTVLRRNDPNVNVMIEYENCV